MPINQIFNTFLDETPVQITNSQVLYKFVYLLLDLPFQELGSQLTVHCLVNRQEVLLDETTGLLISVGCHFDLGGADLSDRLPLSHSLA